MSESSEPPALIGSSANDVVPRPLTASDGGGGGATSSSRDDDDDDEAVLAAARELGREKAREQLARARDAKRICARLMRKLKREEAEEAARELGRQKAREQLVALEEAARELGRTKALEQLAAAEAAAAEAAAQQMLDDEAAAPRGKGKAKEWVRLTRRLLSLRSHGQEVSSDYIRTILDAQDQRETEALAQAYHDLRVKR